MWVGLETVLDRYTAAPRKKKNINNIKTEKCYELVWTEMIWLRLGTRGGLLEHGNEPSGSLKCWEVLEELNKWQFLGRLSYL
jgi:hypothetical protein